MKMEKIMKSLKVLTVVVLVMTTVLMAKNITMDDFIGSKPCDESITQANEIYANCLDNWENECAEELMMIVVKHKILYPQCDYEMLLKPLEKVANEAKDEMLKSYATTTYLLLVSNVELTIDLDNLYNQDTASFFNFVQGQMPKMMVIAANQKLEK